jgi:hypothetical protein
VRTLSLCVKRQKIGSLSPAAGNRWPKSRPAVCYVKNVPVAL